MRRGAGVRIAALAVAAEAASDHAVLHAWRAKKAEKGAAR